MSYIVHVTDSELIEGKSKTTGNPYKMVRVQGILEDGDDRSIFRTILPRDSEVPARGRYIMEYKPSVNQQSLELGGAIVSLKPAPAIQAPKV
jgi:hypothetical protein